MADSLEELIAKNRIAAQANTESAVLTANQGLESSLGDLQTEQGEIDPYYNKLIKESASNYQTNLGAARTSASNAGVYRSGIRYNKELQLGAENAAQTSEYSAERTRKLADISRRRSLLKKQTTDTIGALRTKNGADLEASIADLRYKDYIRKQEDAQRMKEIYASKSGSSLSISDQLKVAGLTDKKAYQSDLSKLGETMLRSGMTREQAASSLYNLYGPTTGLKLEDIQRDIKSSYGNGWETGYYKQNRSVFGKGKGKTGVSDRYLSIINSQIMG